MTFQISKSQEEKLKKWQEAIKELHGKYGLYEYKFFPTGIGTCLRVWSDLAQKEIDLTEYETW